MIELLLGVDFELRGNIHILGTTQHLGIDDIRDDSLIFAREIFV
jgi:hypothetical protein